MPRSSLTAAVGLLFAIALAATAASAAGAVQKPTLRQTGSGWPACDPDVEQWSGYFEVPGEEDVKYYFYWAFGPRNKKPDAPVLLWMSGGPGVSAMTNMLTENGPCLINETTAETYRNAFGWNSEAYVIYLDMPAGTGLSFSNFDHTVRTSSLVADDTYHFVQAFLDAHPELRANEFFVSGPGYAGHFVPEVGHRIAEANRNAAGKPIRLAGVAVGNGFTDPHAMCGSYTKMAGDFCKEKFGKPCTSQDVLDVIEGQTQMHCYFHVNACNDPNDKWSAVSCDRASDFFDTMRNIIVFDSMNPEDIRQLCSDLPCYNYAPLKKFMNSAAVRRMLGAIPYFSEDNIKIAASFVHERCKNSTQRVIDLVENGVRVMIYAGEMDFVYNWIGNKQFTLEMDWSGKEEYNAAADVVFSVDGRPAGRVRSAASATSPIQLSFVQVYDAGRKVPMDQPSASLHIINAFMKNAKP